MCGRRLISYYACANGIEILKDMINGGIGGGVVDEENGEVENIDVVDVETGATTGKRNAAPVGRRRPK
jgi:hypothetical protein